MNKKIRNILIVCLIAIGIAALAIGVYFMMIPSDKEIFSSAFKKNISNIKELDVGSISLFDNISGLKEDVKLKLTTDTSVSAFDSEFKLNGDIYSYLQDMYANVSLTQDGNETFALEAVLKDAKLYHKVKDVYSKFYYVDLDLSSLTKDSNSLDISVILDYLEEAILDYVNDDNLVKEDKTLTLDGNEVETKRYSISFTEKDSLEILKAVVDKLKNNKDFYDLFVSGLKDADIDINSLLNELDDMIKEADDKDKLLTYSIYLDGDTVVSNEFAVSIKSEETSVTVRLTINSYKNKAGYDNFEMYLSTMGFKMFGIEIKGTSATKSDISIYAMDTVSVTGTMESSNTVFNVSLKGNVKVETDDGTTNNEEIFTLEIDGKEVTKSKEYDVNLNMNFDYDDQSFKISSNNKVIIGEDMPDVDLSNSAAIEDMTEEEKEFFSTLFGEISFLKGNEDLLS